MLRLPGVSWSRPSSVHRSLYDQRPAARDLTAFYMWMSLGGVLGGVFAALVAPQIFNAIYEFPLLLLAGLVSTKGLARAWKHVVDRQATITTTGVAVAVIVAIGMACIGGFISPGLGSTIAQSVILACGGYLLLIPGHAAAPGRRCGGHGHPRVLVLPSAINSGFAERSFFGVHRVVNTDDGEVRLLLHGTTLHGAMRIKDAAGQTRPGATAGHLLSS